MTADVENQMNGRRPYLQLFATGVASGALYLLLYLYEKEIMEAFTRSDGFYPALPILAAFMFSIVHGAFAAYFWEVMGIRAVRGD